MKEAVQWIKRIGLFFAGIILIVWGYKANAANNAKTKQVEKPEKTKEKKQESPFKSIEPDNKKKQKNDNDSTQNKTKKGETVVETEKKVEESSGTE